MGFEASERTTRRVAARSKADHVHEHHRVHKPWVTEPGICLELDHGDGPAVAGRPTVPSCAWLAWSRRRACFPLFDKTLPAVAGALERTVRILGGSPTYLLTGNDKTVTTRHVAGLAVRNREPGGVAHYYGVAVQTCVVADPESEAGSEASVKVAKAGVLPRPDNLVSAYASFAELGLACGEASSRSNTPGAPRDERTPHGPPRERAAGAARGPRRALLDGARRDPAGFIASLAGGSSHLGPTCRRAAPRAGPECRPAWRS